MTILSAQLENCFFRFFVISSEDKISVQTPNFYFYLRFEEKEIFCRRRYFWERRSFRPICSFILSSISAGSTKHPKQISKFRYFLQLRFRKAGRVWCGGTRRTHWATCHNIMTPYKIKEFLKSPCFPDLNNMIKSNMY